MLLFSTASQGLLIQSPGRGTQSPLVLPGKLVNNTPPPEASAFSQATGPHETPSQLENSGDLDNSFERPQQMNDNQKDDAAQGSFIPFEQVPDNFGIGNNVSPVEQPRAGLEIDLGPVDDVGPREEINFNQQQPILFQTTEEDIQTFFGGGEIILEQKNNNLEDLVTVKEFAPDPVDNDSGTFVRVVSSDTINTGDNNEALNIPVIIEEGPLAEVETGVEAIKDNRVTDQIRFNEQLQPTFEQLQIQTDNGDFSPVSGFSESSFGQPEEGQRQIIDLTDPKSIIPRIPGNTVSFSFTRFGAGDKATSFGLNLNNDNNIKSVGSKFQTKFNNIIVNGEQNSGSGSDVFFTTPTPTRSPSTSRPPRVSTSSPVRFNAVVRTTTAATTTTRRSTRVATKRTTTTSRPVVFTRVPVTFVESDRSRLKSERLRLQSTRPPGVPGFELFRLPAGTQSDLPRLNVVKAAPPPRPRGPPPTPPSQTPRPRRPTRPPPPGPTESPRRPPPPPPPKNRVPSPPVVNQVFFSQSPTPASVTPPVTRPPLFVFSTPAPGSRSPTPGFPQLPSSTLRPVTPHVTPFSVDVTTRNPFVFHSSPAPLVHEISIPINISEVGNAGHRQNINSPPPHVKQLVRKPKNQFLTGSGFGNSVFSSPFVFLRQQLEEVKANIGLPGQSGQVNPFLAHSVTPQTSRPQFFPTGTVTPTPISPFVFNNPGARPSVPNPGAQQFFSLGPTQAPVAFNPFPSSPTNTNLPAGTFVFRDPTQPVLSPVSPTPIPLSPAATSTTPQPRPDTTRTTSRPIIFSQPTIKPLEGVLLEQNRNNGLDQHIELIIEETSTEDSLQSQNIVKVKKENEEDTESNETEPTEADKLPPFDPRKRRITKKPKLVSAISSNNLGDERNVLSQKPAVKDFDSSTEDLQERLRKLKESIKKTKESLTSQRQNLFVFSPSTTTAAPAHRGVRKRVKSRKRIPSRVRQQQRLKLEENNDAGEITASNEINIPINIVERPRSSGRGRDRQRARGRIRNKIQDVEKNKTATATDSAKTRQELKNEQLERELEETYGKDVVQGLLGVLVTAVSHPDKDRILHQLKAQLSAMNVNDVKKLEFGGDSQRHSSPTAAATTSVKPVIDVVTSTTTLAPDSEEEEKSSEFESALELQLKRVANLANRFKSNKPILVNTQKQTIKSKLPLKVAEKFPVTIPRKIQETLADASTESEPFMPTVSPSTEKTVTSGLSTTLRNLFQTDRIQKIMMSPTTPASVSDSLIDGVPNGEPGLTKNFYERVAPFSEDAITIGPLEVTTTSVLEKTEPEEKLEIVLPLEIVEINESTTANSAVEEIVNIGFNNVGTKTVSKAHELENSIKKMMENADIKLNLKESIMTENEIQNLHAEMIVNDQESATVRPSFEKLVIKERKEEQMKEQIFNSSDLVLTNFMVHKVKESEETAENDVNEPSSSTTAATADQTTTAAAKMVPTPLTKNDADFKSRRRNLFRNKNGKIKKGSLLNKFKKFDRSRFRKLQRNHKPGSSNSSSDQNIIIEEKKNPRKIIFRKNLIRGERRRVPASLNNDPLVKSLQRQIKSQKSKLFSSRKRPFTKLETSPPETEKVQF